MKLLISPGFIWIQYMGSNSPQWVRNNLNKSAFLSCTEFRTYGFPCYNSRRKIRPFLTLSIKIVPGSSLSWHIHLWKSHILVAISHIDQQGSPVLVKTCLYQCILLAPRPTTSNKMSSAYLIQVSMCFPFLFEQPVKTCLTAEFKYKGFEIAVMK